jgi:signal transduction histidine kinase
MATLVDVSARKLADQRLADTTVERDDLRRRFIQAQEQERVRLARELHDQTGQSLAAVMLDLKNIENASKETERPRFRDLRRRLEHVGQTLHHVAWELRPASIDELGLENAVANYIAEWSRQYGIEVDFHRSGATLDGISDEISTTLYRVVQEALTNVIKHAGSATAVSIVVERTSERLCLTIEDNGRGFDVVESSFQATIRQGGLGLAGMRERLTLIGAELEIESSIGVGTTIFARIPLQQVRAA